MVYIKLAQFIPEPHFPRTNLQSWDNDEFPKQYESKN